MPLPRSKQRYDRDDLRTYPLWKHRKGGVYHVLGVARCSTNGERCGAEDSVIYFSLGHQTLNYREVGEFLDGRFEPVEPEHPDDARHYGLRMPESTPDNDDIPF